MSKEQIYDLVVENLPEKLLDNEDMDLIEEFIDKMVDSVYSLLHA